MGNPRDGKRGRALRGSVSYPIFPVGLWLISRGLILGPHGLRDDYFRAPSFLFLFPLPLLFSRGVSFCVGVSVVLPVVIFSFLIWFLKLDYVSGWGHGGESLSPLQVLGLLAIPNDSSFLTRP